MSADLVCLWCGKSFHPRTTGGSAQRFCCSAHRHAFGSAARSWAVKLIEVGLITCETLRATRTSVRAVHRPFQRETNLAGVGADVDRELQPDMVPGYRGDEMVVDACRGI